MPSIRECFVKWKTKTSTSFLGDEWGSPLTSCWNTLPQSQLFNDQRKVAFTMATGWCHHTTRGLAGLPPDGMVPALVLHLSLENISHLASPGNHAAEVSFWTSSTCPQATVTKCHKLGGLQEQEVLVSGCWWSWFLQGSKGDHPWYPLIGSLIVSLVVDNPSGACLRCHMPSSPWVCLFPLIFLKTSFYL